MKIPYIPRIQPQVTIASQHEGWGRKWNVSWWNLEPFVDANLEKALDIGIMFGKCLKYLTVEVVNTWNTQQMDEDS